MGVKVYVPLTELSITEGFHVPLIPFVEVFTNAGTALPIQIDWNVPKLNTGVTIELTVTVNVYDKKQPPPAGVNT